MSCKKTGIIKIAENDDLWDFNHSMKKVIFNLKDNEVIERYIDSKNGSKDISYSIE
jgi:hypothetical protein